MESVLALHGKKTVIIVAHRLSTVEQCDHILKLEEGRIQQAGTSAAVLATM
jgi:ABC-type bacteriocin/lantibiotic exporter with double-glycine peptidase domain